jgi:hypothetical protein
MGNDSVMMLTDLQHKCACSEAVLERGMGRGWETLVQRCDAN